MCIVQDTLYSQNFRAKEPQKDSVVRVLKNGDINVRYIFLPVEPQQVADTAMVGLRVLSSESSATSRLIPKVKPKSSDMSSFTVGSIPIQSGVTPTGGKTYTIPIKTVPGYHLEPELSIFYNSQSGNGVVGYGWSISGLSSIEIRNKNVFYDGTQVSAMYTDTSACYSLNGEPIVKSENIMKGYELATAKGNIQIHKTKNDCATPAYFEALYPDGSRAIFGFKNNNESQISYPLTEYEDIEGNKMSFEYEMVENAYYLKSVSYGMNAKTVFEYSDRRHDPSPYKNTVAGKSVMYNKRLLKIIKVIDGDNQLCQYTFTHKFKDDVNLLKVVRYRVNYTKQLPPLQFEYGIDNEIPECSPGFEKIGVNTYLSAYTKSDNLSVIYKRGWIMPRFIGDGMIELPNLPNYGIVASSGNVFKKYYKYGSKYANNTSILVNKYGYYSSRQDVIKAGSGFQIIEVADVNGDGIDEIVKVNNSCNRREVTDYIVTIYSYDSNERMDSTRFSFSINDGTYNKYYNNPAKSDYFFGDFRGDGKIQMLVMTRNKSKSVLVDLDKKEKLSEDYLFARREGDENYMFITDFEGKGKSDFCYMSDTDLQIYSVKSLTGRSFSKTNTYSSVNRNVVSQSMPISSVVMCRSIPVDINGDGYMDIVSYPEANASVVDAESSNVINVSYFDGKGFVTETKQTFERPIDSDIMFIDVDKDGFPDIISLQNNSIHFIPNVNGLISDEMSNVGIKVDSSTDLLPINNSLWGQSGELITVSGCKVTLYGSKINHGLRRKIVQMKDSYGNLEYNKYKNISIPNVYTSFSYDNKFGEGFFSRVFPLFVMVENTKFTTEQLAAFYQYHYTDAVYNNYGLGFCGFRVVETSEAVSGINMVQYYNPEKFGVLVKSVIRKTDEQTPYVTITNTYDNHTAVYGKLDPRLISAETRYGLSGITTRVVYTYDKYGYPLTVETKKELEGFPEQSSILRNRYAYITMPGEYVLGVLLNDAIDNNLDSNVDSVWRESHTYLREKYCHLTQQITNCGMVKSGRSAENTMGTQQISSIMWTYDSKWNVTSKKTSSYTSTEYVGNTDTYGLDGRFCQTSTDPLGNTTTYSSFSSWGVPTRITDANGNETLYEYDNYGTLLKTTKPDGAQYSTSYEWGGKSLYKVIETGCDMPQKITHYDSMNREVCTQVSCFDGTIRSIEKEYDAQGRLVRQSLPYKTDSARYWITYAYDDYGRLLSKSEPSGKISSWIYDGTATTSIVDGVSSTKKTDAAGNVVSIIDGGGSVRYDYRDDGQPCQILTPTNVKTTFEYDNYGRRTKIIDPSAGIQTEAYVWNTDGTSTSTHTNPNGWLITHKDKYGRSMLVECSDGSSTVYTYDLKGRLSSEVSMNGCAKEYLYDRFDRIVRLKESVPNGKYLESKYGYRVGGKVDSIRYDSHHTHMVTESYQYINGYRTCVKLKDGTIVWDLKKENEFGQPTEVYTNGLKREYGYTDFGYPSFRRIDEGDIQDEIYEFDPITGNLISRVEFTGGPEESFTYDNMNRLVGINDRVVKYADNGNITEIGDVGQMYYSNPRKPYQITGLRPEKNDLGGHNQSVTYSCFNRPLTITEGENSVSFIYDSGGRRARMEERKNGVLQKVHWYVGDKYEYISNGDGSLISEVLYLGGSAYNAPMIWRNGNCSWQIGRDYLGSVKQVVAPDGALSGDYSYDPWGRMRNKYTLEVYSNGMEPGLFIGRGFTGHEHLPQFGLINMNARLYDPLLGRFLSPDPFVQSPWETQSFNRYSYALNNPLKYTDENGEWVVFTSMAWLPGTVIAGCWIPAIMSIFNSDKANALFNKVWSKYGQVVVNAAKIDAGWFYSDPHKNLGERVWEVASRFTWQFKQEVMGNTLQGVWNLVGDVKDVGFYGGATVTQTYNAKWGAVTLGSYITGQKGIQADPENRLFQHEYGHYIQSQKSGIAYLARYGIPSLLSDPQKHKYHPVEQDANIRAFRYFMDNEVGFKASYWDGYYNKILGYDINNHSDVVKLLSLTNGIVNPTIWDYSLSTTTVGSIVSGLINSSIDKTKY